MSAFADWNVAFLGCGRMGSALARGACAAGTLPPTQVFCIDTAQSLAQTLADDLGATAGRPDDGNTLWVVAVKPKDVEAALRAQKIATGDVVLTCAAGVRLETIRGVVGNGPSLVRAMPNTPALVGAAITGVFGDDSDAATSLAVSLFRGVGEVVSLKSEEQFDAVTALSGSGPAYVFVAIEALADGGVLMGLDRATATKLAIHTVLGGATLAAAEGSPHPAELKDRVASPGGTTIAGLRALEEHGFRSSLIEAVRAAAERSAELGEK